MTAPAAVHANVTIAAAAAAYDTYVSASMRLMSSYKPGEPDVVEVEIGW